MDFFTQLSPMNNLGSRKEITKWLYNIHNMVNDKLGVPKCDIPSFEEVEDQYQSFRASCKPLTESERSNNAGKGCVAPQDGKPKRSVIQVVEYTPQPTKTSPLQEFPKSDDYFVLHKKTLYIIIMLLIVLTFVGIWWMLSSKGKKNI